MRTEIEGDQLVTYTADGTFFSSQPVEAQTPPPPSDRLAVAKAAEIAAKEAVLAAGTLTVERIVAADSAGADAYLAALEAP